MHAVDVQPRHELQLPHRRCSSNWATGNLGRKTPLRAERFGSTIARKPSMSRRFLTLSRLFEIVVLARRARAPFASPVASPSSYQSNEQWQRRPRRVAYQFIRGTARICEALNSFGSFSNTARQLIRPPTLPDALGLDRLTATFRYPAERGEFGPVISQSSLARIS